MFSHAAKQDNLTTLKQTLIESIDHYLNEFNPRTPISLQDGYEFRFHYQKGGEGIARAERYKTKVNDFKNEIDLLTSVLNDLKKAHKTRQSEGVITKAVSHIQSYLFPPEKPEPNDLGNSERLAENIAFAVCNFYQLSTYDNNTYAELTTMNRSMGELYIQNMPGRQILAIEKHLKSLAQAAEASRNPPSPEIDSDSLDADGWPKLN